MNTRDSNPRDAFRLAVVPLPLALVLASFQAIADGHVFTATNEKWRTECGECHVAYLPQLLPANSWKAVMAGLDRHFGTDASLDTETATEIRAFLEGNAGRERRKQDAPPTLRITETRWFVREHDELAASIWKHPRVKAAANCAACHIGADQGNFSERDIKVPK
jgi:Dihaem cytochrome c